MNRAAQVSVSTRYGRVTGISRQPCMSRLSAGLELGEHRPHHETAALIDLAIEQRAGPSSASIDDARQLARHDPDLRPRRAPGCRAAGGGGTLVGLPLVI